MHRGARFVWQNRIQAEATSDLDVTCGGMVGPSLARHALVCEAGLDMDRATCMFGPRHVQAADFTMQDVAEIARCCRYVPLLVITALDACVHFDMRVMRPDFCQAMPCRVIDEVLPILHPRLGRQAILAMPHMGTRIDLGHAQPMLIDDLARAQVEAESLLAPEEISSASPHVDVLAGLDVGNPEAIPFPVSDLAMKDELWWSRFFENPWTKRPLADSSVATEEPRNTAAAQRQTTASARVAARHEYRWPPAVMNILADASWRPICSGSSVPTGTSRT
eukprot:CAMPEP_0115642834 /NCGR_PEP_ID=MMETSP0272-20121206/37044_1 /TAXON_ID=71861 /ORGANISM="Scrippsiella trochoidea, Strain CCMP3099" /LENGTH=277 /DNA_ID=CAMNT_0003080193 /DNA_START=1011 /DNA_END=1842 /DNA_ORIENTATION=-